MTKRPLYVVKLGGAAVRDEAAVLRLARQFAAILNEQADLVLVHGGGLQISRLAGRLGLTSTFVAGRRVTDDALLTAAKMALVGEVGTDLAAILNSEGVPTVAISGVAGRMILASRRPPEPVNYGHVGDVTKVDPRVPHALLAAGLVPLVASISADERGKALNLNADTVASALAVALQASRLFLLTDTGALLADRDQPASRITDARLADLDRLERHAADGMLPKLAAVRSALTHGVPAVHIAGFDTATSIAAAVAGQAGTVFT